MLEDVLSETIATQSAQAGVAKYRELREKYYGGFVFDFGENVLLRLAQQLQAGGKSEEALAMLKLNAEFYPDSWMTFLQLAELYSTKGEKTAAIERYKKTLSLNPENGRAKKMLEELMKE